MSETRFTLTLDRASGYRFSATSGREGAPVLVADEPPPLGEGAGATPTELLGTAVGACLASSLLFCLEKARIPVADLKTRVEGQVERNEKGRLRVSRIDVTMDLFLAPGGGNRIDRCLSLFEDFCTVSGSVGQGIDIKVVVNQVVTAEAGTDPEPETHRTPDLALTGP